MFERPFRYTREKKLDSPDVLAALSTIGVQETTDLAQVTVQDLVDAGCAIIEVGVVEVEEEIKRPHRLTPGQCD